MVPGRLSGLTWQLGAFWINVAAMAFCTNMVPSGLSRLIWCPVGFWINMASHLLSQLCGPCLTSSFAYFWK